jgi:DNA-binding LacI/PurR family transcriptional regulator
MHRELSGRMVDGFIVLSRGLTQSIPHYKRLLEAGVPFVSLYPMPGLNADCAYVDTRRAFFELTKHLIDYGHRKIGLMLDASTTLYTENRETGFRNAMKKAGVRVNEDWVVRVTPDGAPVAADERSQKNFGRSRTISLGSGEARNFLPVRTGPPRWCVSPTNSPLGCCALPTWPE